MADDIEPGSGKKHRIIHWNPDAGNEKVKRRWTLPRILLWSAIVFVGGLFVAGGVIRAIKLVKPNAFSNAPESAPVDPMVEFRSQNDAGLALQGATKALATISKLSFQDHPKQVDKYLLIQKDFAEGSRLYGSHDYAQSLALLKSVNERITDFALSIQTKQEAQNLYNALILKIKDMEIARSLAPEALDQATEAAGTSNRLLADGDFLLAKHTIEQGMTALKKAEDAIAAKVQESIWTGQQALQAGDRAGAKAAFQAALDRAPDNEAAKQGLKRSDTIDRVHALLLRADEFEKNGDYDQAAEAYKNAFALDAFSATAQQGESRAKQLSIDTKFNTAYKAAQDAFAAKDWDKAIVQAKAALAVNSSKPDVTKMLKDAQQNQHTDAVQKALKRGQDAADLYNWVAAKDGFQDALTLEPDNDDAKAGIIQASQMIRALTVYNARIEDAERLAAGDDFVGSIGAFNDAMSVKPSYLADSEKIQQLHALLQVQKDPVPVTFVSDQKTFVSIEGFMNLNLISTATKNIRPGDYMIIGRRNGYKEVRIPIQVRGGMKLQPIQVICTVKADKP